jgi:hypothetical protein
MTAGNPVNSLAAAFYRAIDHDLPDIQYERRLGGTRDKDGNYATEAAIRRPNENDVEVYHFLQTWGSTALGFGGVGGSAMTSAYTTVVISEHQHAAVYFGGRAAYVIRNVNNEFWSDLRSFDMAACGKTRKYRPAAASQDHEVTE